MKANHAGSSEEHDNATELSTSDILKTDTNVEVTNSAAPTVASNTTYPIISLFKLIKNTMQSCMVSLKVQRNMSANVISTVSHVHVDSEITSQNICDCFCLGKYKESAERPCPILMKLTRAIDVTSLLSNHGSLPNNILQTCPKAKCTIESLLIKGRWCLVQIDC